MQFEDFDKKIIDAAEHHHPAYEEKAWEKMEMLLDKHMPVKKDDRRRIIFFLFLFLSLGSGTFLIFRGNDKSKTQATTQQALDSKKVSGSSDEKPESSSKDKTTESKTAIKVADSPETKTTSEATKTATGSVGNDDLTSSIVANSNKTKTNNSEKIKVAPAFNSTEKSTTFSVKNKNNKKINSANSLKNKSAGDIAMNLIVTEKNNKQKNTTVSSDVVSDAATVKQEANQTTAVPAIVEAIDTTLQKKSDEQDVKADEKNSSTAIKKESKKPGKQKQFPLAFTFSAGPDLSFISVSQLGKVTMRYGAGLGYTFSRFTLRSGFYVSKKIYSAEGYNYHPFYANLERVDGDCKVFEIPVTVSYNFAQRKNYNWFASTGLSSYLMKRETYDYVSKDPATGYSYYNTRTWNDKNKHYFSVLNLSAGYERKFTKAISVIVEPYLQIPLTGIGNGKMKLNSGGILFTLSVKPFSGKK